MSESHVMTRTAVNEAILRQLTIGSGMADHSLQVCASLRDLTPNGQTIRVEVSAWDRSSSRGGRERSWRRM
jgi:hypothetical protein